MKQKEAGNQIILIASIAAAAAVMVWFIISTRHLPRYDYSIDDWKSEYAVYRDNGYAVNDSLKDSGVRTPSFIWGPYKPLKKGSYTAIINYSADADQMCYVTAKGYKYALFRSSPPILSKEYSNINYQFETVENIDEFQLVFPYSGSGDFVIHSISIVANHNRQKRIASELIALIIFINIWRLLAKQKKDRQKTAVLLAGIVFFVSLPLFIRGIHVGYEIEYYLNRVGQVIQNIRNRQFLNCISENILVFPGYVFHYFSNDMLLLFPACLRLLGFPLSTAYKIHIFLINLITVGISYYSFRRIFNSGKAGLFLSLLYSSASYQLVSIYMRVDICDYSAQVFLPLIALAVCRIYDERPKTGKRLLRNSSLLAVWLSGILCSSFLLFSMTLFMLLLTALFFFRRTFQKQTILSIALSLLLTIILNLCFPVPYFDHTPEKSFIERDDPGIIAEPAIQENGASPGSFFGFFRHLSETGNTQHQESSQCTPGLPLMIILFSGIGFILGKGRNKRILYFLFFSLLSLWMSSNIFPWNWLILNLPFGKYLAIIQFPWKFMIFAVLFLSLTAGELTGYLKSRTFWSGVMIITFVMLSWFVSDFGNHSNTAYIYDTNGMGLDHITDKKDMDYVPIIEKHDSKSQGLAGPALEADLNIREPGIWPRLLVSGFCWLILTVWILQDQFQIITKKGRRLE